MNNQIDHAIQERLKHIEEFEVWLKKVNVHEDFMYKHDQRTYTDHGVDLAFEAWQEAKQLNQTSNIYQHPVFQQIIEELSRAVNKFPTWPTDPLHALAILGEEYGELTKAVLQLAYEPHKSSKEQVRAEAIQTATMSLRFALSLDKYIHQQNTQHSQDVEQPITY